MDEKKYNREEVLYIENEGDGRIGIKYMFERN
jgi:hypothetical protein